jgi:uncharacterized membrane protein
MQEHLKFMAILIAIDSIWLYGNFKEHKLQIESVQKSPLKVDKLAGILFYVIAVIAHFKFVIPYSKTAEEAFKKGALIGFLMYATFDLTNKAIFSDYTWEYAIKDTLWGSFAIGLASYFYHSVTYS